MNLSKKNGADAFKKLVENSLSLIEYKIKVLRNTINTENTEGKIKFLNNTADILAKVDNLLEREMVIKKLSKEYEISEESISSEIFKRIKPKTHFRTAVVNLDEYKNVKKATANKDVKLNHYEKMLLAFLCVDNSVYKVLKDRINVDSFTYEENRNAAEIALERLADNKGIVPGELLNILGNEFASNFARIIQEECNCEDNHKAVLDILKRMELFKLEKRQKEILEILSINNGKIEGDVEKLKEELKSILLKKKGI